MSTSERLLSPGCEIPYRESTHDKRISNIAVKLDGIRHTIRRHQNERNTIIGILCKQNEEDEQIVLALEHYIPKPEFANVPSSPSSTSPLPLSPVQDPSQALPQIPIQAPLPKNILSTDVGPASLLICGYFNHPDGSICVDKSCRSHHVCAKCYSRQHGYYACPIIYIRKVKFAGCPVFHIEVLYLQVFHVVVIVAILWSVAVICCPSFIVFIVQCVAIALLSYHSPAVYCCPAIRCP
ncbi:hypothetical protein BC936DRAFT_147710, partial [Jimgerdemannia flammicorona]